MNAIETVELSKSFGTHKAVKKLSLKVPEGSVCGFLGKNGAGKTTTIKMLVGLVKPSSGTIKIMDVERKFGSCDNRNIGYLPDVPNFYGYMTGYEYLKFCGDLYGMDGRKLKVRIINLLNQVGLKNIKTTLSGYSRGMKQRLGIAQALINDPDVIFMDEPISALDPIGRHDIMEIIRSLRGTVTLFFSTHILADVETACDYILILDKGKVLADDSLTDIKQKHSSNTAKIKLNSAEDGEIFYNHINNVDGITAEKVTPLEFLLRSDNVRELGIKVPRVISDAGLSLESYQTYVPSLEEIFLEVTGNA